MDRLRVKICCIMSADEARMTAEAGADLLGLVGPMPSGPGVVTLDEARQIAELAPPSSQPILLTSSETATAIADDAKRAGVSAVQVVCDIGSDEARRLANTELHYVQVVHVEDETALDSIDVYADHCAAYLLDSGRPKDGVLGGTGKKHDWALSKAFCRQSPRPVFLAGGLNPDNVSEAIRRVRPSGVDICSGLRRDGRLDPALLSAFMTAITEASNELEYGAR